MRSIALVTPLFLLLTACTTSHEERYAAALPRSVQSEVEAQKTAAPAVRRLVKKVELVLNVADTAAASESLDKLTAEFGGHVGSMNTTRNDNGSLQCEMTLRVPEGRLAEALARIKKLANRVDRESTTAEDVTDKFVDLSARLKTLEKTESELQALLGESRQRQQKTEDIMAIYRELTQIRSNIEQLRGQLNVVENLTSLATIHVTLVPPLAPVHLSSWQPIQTVRESVSSLAAVLTGLADLGIRFVIVIIPPTLIIGLSVWLLAKVFRSLRARRNVPVA